MVSATHPPSFGSGPGSRARADGSMSSVPAAAPAAVRWPVTAVLAAVLVAIGDVLLARVGAEAPLPLASLLSALVAAVGLYGAPALLYGALLALWISALPRELRDLDLRRALIAAEPEADLRRAGLLLWGALTALLLVLVLYLFARGVAVEMANKRNTALSTALFAPLALLLAGVLALPALSPLRALCRRLPAPRVVLVLGLLAIAAGGVVLLALATVDWRAIRFGPAKAAASFLILQWLLLRLGVAQRLGQIQPGARRPSAASLATLGVGTTLLLLSLAYTYGVPRGGVRFGDDERARALLGEHTAGAKPLLVGLRRLFDRDHDGYAPNLGGGDCDDHDPAVHPGAADIPGDGIDQDCEGGDERAAPSEPAEPAPAPPVASAGKAPRRWDGNWLIITIDTLRSDRVNAKTAPRLAALASKSALFNAYAQAPNTPRSFPSFLTARLPSQVHFTRKTLNFSPVSGKDPTLFTALAAAGYRNIGVFSHFYMEEKIGLHKGFAEWRNDGATTLHDSNSDVAAPRITARVVARLRKLGQEARAGQAAPFALWTHLFDPHSTYMDHQEFPVAGKGTRFLGERYDAEVSFTDKHVGMILDALREAGLSERTAVVVFADHGEAFGEHRLGGEPLYFHGESLYDEVLRVPLLFYVPGLAPVATPQRVMLVDLAPTVLALSGVPVPAEFQGRSLAPLLAGRPLPERPIFAEMLPCTSFMHSQRVVIQGDYKLYMKYTENTAELYNLREDPTEQKNLYHSQPERARALKALLAQRRSEVTEASEAGGDARSDNR